MAFADPSRIVSQLHLSGSETAADFGAGSGVFSLALARMLPEGKVYALDLQRSLVGKVGQSATEARLGNVFALWADLEKPGGSGLGNGSVDLVLVANTLFQVGHKHSFLEEASRMLRANGRLVIVDWTDSFGGMGPQAADVCDEQEARALAESIGFVFDRTLDAGEHHYGLVFRKHPN